MPLEVFVHGALCVAYSGQCLTSEALGGRSANRGQCAQACRLPYELIVDGTKRDMAEMAYLLSPQDLAAHDLVEDLAKAGVGCLKIEGRLKSAQYVAATTQTYRAALDAAANGIKFVASHAQQQDLAQSFSRGFTHGFLDGVDHQSLVHARFPKSRGIRAGRVVGATERGVLVKIESGVFLKNGDGIVFDEGHPEQDEQGGRVVETRPHRGDRQTLEIAIHRGDVNLRAVVPGSTVWKTDDPEIRRRLERSYSRDQITRRIRLDVDVTAMIGRRLEIHASADGNSAEVEWDRELEPAVKFSMTREIFKQQFSRLGDTPFELGTVHVNGDPVAEFPPVMIPKSVLNDLRRQAVEKLVEQRGRKRTHHASGGDGLADLRNVIASKVAPPLPETHELHVLCRSLPQLEAMLSLQAEAWQSNRPMIYCEFEDIRKYPDAVKLAHAAGVKIALATVRVVKPSEHGLLRQVAQAGLDAILVRNLAGLSLFAQNFPHIPLIADYSLNVANELTADLIAESGAIRLTPGYDLNWTQMQVMFSRISPAWFEAVIHQQIPMFHMEHCVFAHTLSEGKDFRDCGRPCESHRVELRDRAGAAHPLAADVGCRNTVYNGTAQSAAEYVPKMLAMGIRHFRVELLRQSPEESAALVQKYLDVLGGKGNPKEIWRSLRVLNQLGVTRGTLE
jgi:putative protease